MDGWVKLYRCLLDKAIWQRSSPEHKAVLITILLLANHAERQWVWGDEKFEARPGQFITSLDSLAQKAGVSIKNVRTALQKFEKLEFLANKSAKTGRLITVVNWGLYQHSDEDTGKQIGKQVAKDRQTGGKQAATNKNVKKGNKSIYTQAFDEFWSSYPAGGRKNKEQTAKNLASLLKNVPAEHIVQAARNYSAECEADKRTDYFKVSSNFVGRAEYFKDYLPGVWTPRIYQPDYSKVKL